jgi:hypothetical protein
MRHCSERPFDGNGTLPAFTKSERSKRNEKNQDEHQVRPPQVISRYLQRGSELQRRRTMRTKTNIKSGRPKA